MHFQRLEIIRQTAYILLYRNWHISNEVVNPLACTFYLKMVYNNNNGPINFE